MYIMKVNLMLGNNYSLVLIKLHEILIISFALWKYYYIRKLTYIVFNFRKPKNVPFLIVWNFGNSDKTLQ